MQSRKYVKKAMGLSAVARPSGGFDGRVGLHKVAYDRGALRESKFHKCGDVYKVDCEMDADLFYKMLTEELLPDIREKMIDFDSVNVQMDRAPLNVR